MHTNQRMLVSALVVVALATLPAAAAGKAQATVTWTVNGESASSVSSGSQVSFSGSGYKAGAKLALCIGSEGCTYPQADRDGTFWQTRTLYTVGTQNVQVSEIAPNFSSYRLKATTTINIVP